MPPAGVATADFVLFPPRWLVAQHTFRPPYYHRRVRLPVWSWLVNCLASVVFLPLFSFLLL